VESAQASGVSDGSSLATRPGKRRFWRGFEQFLNGTSAHNRLFSAMEGEVDVGSLVWDSPYRRRQRNVFGLCQKV